MVCPCWLENQLLTNCSFSISIAADSLVVPKMLFEAVFKLADKAKDWTLDPYPWMWKGHPLFEIITLDPCKQLPQFQCVWARIKWMGDRIERSLLKSNPSDLWFADVGLISFALKPEFEKKVICILMKLSVVDVIKIKNLERLS